MVDKVNLNLKEENEKKLVGKGSGQEGKRRGPYNQKPKKKNSNNDEDNNGKKLDRILWKLDRIGEYHKIEDWPFENENEDVIRNRAFVNDFISLWKKFKDNDKGSINLIRNQVNNN